MNIVGKLTEAKALIEKGWTQGAGARTETGKLVWGGDEYAVCWCSVGALDRVTGHPAAHDKHKQYMRLKAELEQHLPTPFRTVIQFNDHHDTTQAMVLEVFDKAIKANQGKERRE